VSGALAVDAGGQPVFAGLALDAPWASATRPDATINVITRVDYRAGGPGAPGGQWRACQAQDGAFDSVREAYTCPAAEGVAPQVRAVNRLGAAGPLPYSVYLPAALFSAGQMNE
jgi:hypothetical protein